MPSIPAWQDWRIGAQIYKLSESPLCHTAACTRQRLRWARRWQLQAHSKHRPATRSVLPPPLIPHQARPPRGTLERSSHTAMRWAANMDKMRRWRRHGSVELTRTRSDSPFGRSCTTKYAGVGSRRVRAIRWNDGNDVTFGAAGFATVMRSLNGNTLCEQAQLA